MNLAIVDLECTSLRSDQGFLLCAGIKPLGGKPTVIGLHQWLPQSRKFDPLAIDAGLVVTVRDEMQKFDGWITWNGLMFDLPWLDDRLMLNGQNQLERRFARGLDMMWHARMGKSALSSSRLDSVARNLNLKVQKTALDLGVWKRAEAEARALFKCGRDNYDYILEHNLKDLEVTEAVYEHLKPRVVTISKR